MKSNTSTSQKKRTMKTSHLLIALMLLGALLLAGCGSGGRVGAMQNESQSVELGNVESVRVDIEFSGGNLVMSGGAEELLDADFTYNVAKLKPKVEYTDGLLTLRQPEARGLPVLRDIEDFQNEWDLRLNDTVPMDLRMDVGGGTSDLKLASLSLTGLDVNLGAGSSKIDLSGDWAHDLDVTISAGAADITVKLPADVGVRVEVQAAISSVDASGLNRDGNVYTNDAYSVSEVTLHVDMDTGIGHINLELEEAAAASD